MTAPDAFATATDADAYGYSLPDGAEAGLLARATQLIRDEAGVPVTDTTSTAHVTASCGALTLPTPASLVSQVTAVALVAPDGTTSPVTGWQWRRGKVWLPVSVSLRDRDCGTFAVTWEHGLASLPAGLKRLTCAVAARLGATPPGALMGLQSRSVGSVSWTAGAGVTAGLTRDEQRTLAGIVPVRNVWQVPV